MPCMKYIEHRFHKASLKLIEIADAILEEYREEGLIVSLRQLYYRMVARGHILNNKRTYKKLVKLLTDARLAGLIDWEMLEDRHRTLRQRGHWNGAADIIDGAARSYGIDLWRDQDQRVEVWFEKDALLSVFEPVCRDLDVAYFSCKGYTSASEMWRAGQRMLGFIKAGQTPIIFYLGDHDPSGVQMTEDIQNRMDLFTGCRTMVKRLALTMEQVQEHEPVPNYAKVTDARYASYVAQYGEECWELDALDPKVLSAIVEDAVLFYRDERKFKARKRKQERQRKDLIAVSERWSDVVRYVRAG